MVSVWSEFQQREERAAALAAWIRRGWFNQQVRRGGVGLSKKIIFTGREKWEQFYAGTRDETSSGITWRPNPHLLLDLQESYNCWELLFEFANVSYQRVNLVFS
jgi:hypothetical protein